MTARRPRGALPRPIAVIAASPPGARLAARLAQAWPEAECHVLARYLADGGGHARPLRPPMSETVGELFERCRGLVVFLPVGAVVRLIAPRLCRKFRDPAVVAVDDGGRYAISVLSSHEGGGNRLAEGVGAVLGAQPIITTALPTTPVPFAFRLPLCMFRALPPMNVSSASTSPVKNLLNDPVCMASRMR